MAPDLRAVEILRRHGVPFVVIGGHKIDPATGIERTHPVSAAFVQAERLMMLCTSVGFLDLFDYVPGFPDVPVSEIWDTALDVGGVRFASLACLRQIKRAAGRPKDLLDLENLFGAS